LCLILVNGQMRVPAPREGKPLRRLDLLKTTGDFRDQA
jgi:hypothetical protein